MRLEVACPAVGVYWLGHALSVWPVQIGSFSEISSTVTFVRFIGHPDGCDLPLPTGAAIEVGYREVIEVEDAFARQLLEQPANWERASGPATHPGGKPGKVVSPLEVFRRSLRQLRQQQKLSLVELAMRVDTWGCPMTRNRLSEIESGASKRGPTLDEVCGVALALNVSPARLLEGTSLQGPLRVAITGSQTTTLFGFRSWFRGRLPLRKDGERYRLGVADEDYLHMQRTTVQLLTGDIADLIDKAEEYRDDPSDPNRHALAGAIDRVAERNRTLTESHSNFPSERPHRRERRGRPRKTASR